MKLKHVVLLCIGVFISSFSISYFASGLFSKSNATPIILQSKSCGHNIREYQIRLEPDAAYLYDGSRLVGVVPYYDNPKGLDSIIIADNL